MHTTTMMKRLRAKGELGDMIVTFIITIFCMIILISGVNYMSAAKDYATANQISRKYILKMETMGYLPSYDYSRLVDEMYQAGFQDISLVGSTSTKQNFGEEVTLNVTFTQGMLETTFLGNAFTRSIFHRRFNIKRTSTSKG